MKYKFTLLVLFFANLIFADTPVDAPADADAPAASIEQNAMVACALAILFGLVFILKYKQKAHLAK